MSTSTRPSSRQLLLPTEHGSWALVFEPVALGLLAAPSLGGFGVAVGVAAAFLARKPLRVWARPRPSEKEWRGTAAGWVLLLATLAGAGVLTASVDGGVSVLAPLAIAVPIGVFFLARDQTNQARLSSSELTAAALCALPAVSIALAAQWDLLRACALGLCCLSRSIPVVLTVRTALRRRRGEALSLWPALLAQLVAPLLVGTVIIAGMLPWPVFAAHLLLCFRGLMLLSGREAVLSARRLGIVETFVGIAYVAGVAVSLRFA